MCKISNLLFLYIAGVDGRKLTVDSYIRLVEMMNFTLNLAFGLPININNSTVPIVKDPKTGLYIFIPKAEILDYTDLKQVYYFQAFA